MCHKESTIKMSCAPQTTTPPSAAFFLERQAAKRAHKVCMAFTKQGGLG